MWIQSTHRLAKPVDEDHIAVALALRDGPVRGEVRAVPHVVIEAAEDLQGSGLDNTFRDETHRVPSSPLLGPVWPVTRRGKSVSRSSLTARALARAAAE